MPHFGGAQSAPYILRVSDRLDVVGKVWSELFEAQDLKMNDYYPQPALSPPRQYRFYGALGSRPKGCASSDSAASSRRRAPSGARSRAPSAALSFAPTVTSSGMEDLDILYGDVLHIDNTQS
ncbi:hypothetical protein PG984_011983 [Apiospora sp. TS-2023a]